MKPEHAGSKRLRSIRKSPPKKANENPASRSKIAIDSSNGEIKALIITALLKGILQLAWQQLADALERLH